ncbi:LuxR C-terminal-related transcriptional regulator [Falsiroseomonas sp. HW251]|uniref:LuxR C-terminal-related transcriptional regulator n=1 Tax=Falsiroseomonas sp. HW251 TaxID=3390998 RepID=UPI003D31B254
MNDKTRIAIVEPTPIFLEGIKHVLVDAGYDIFYCTRSLDDFCESELGKIADILMVSLPATYLADCSEQMEGIRARMPKAKIVALVDSVTAYEVSQIWSFLDGLMVRNIDAQALIKALDMIALGERLMLGIPRNSTLGSAHISIPGGGLCASEFSHLSPREVDVLRSLSAGSSNKIIARQIGVSEATVKVHMKRILRKLKARNRTEAAMWAKANGLGFDQATPR